MSWRGIFAGLTALGIVLLLAGAAGLPETLPAARRSTGGLRGTLHGFRLLRQDRLYMGVALFMAIAGASIFAYLAGATFVLQKIYGPSPQGYSLAFALNSLGFMLLGQFSGRLARRWPASHLLAAGLALNLAGAASLCAVTLWHLPLVLLLASLFVLVTAIALATPPATALALAEYPSMAGAASSLLGFFGMVCGAAAAPFVGIAGERSAIPLVIVALSLSVGGNAIFRAIVWPRTRKPQHDHTAVPDPRAEVQPCAPTA